MTNKRGKTYESPDLAKTIASLTRALVRRATEGDLEALSALAASERAAHDALQTAAREAHEGINAYSWTEIGRELGITRQAAQHRFGDRDEATA